MSIGYYELEQSIKGINKRLRRVECCSGCIVLENCLDGEIPTWDAITETWICGAVEVGSGHDSLTLELGLVTQDSANLNGQELELEEVTSLSYGVMSPADKIKLDGLSGVERTITVVANYAALPAPATVPDEFYFAEASQGTAWLPGSLGGTYRPAGLYYSTGVVWITDISPWQATQADVDAGIITDQFVSPATLNASTTVSHPGHTHVTADITDFPPSLRLYVFNNFS